MKNYISPIILRRLIFVWLFLFAFYLNAPAQEFVYVCPEGTTLSNVYGRLECKAVGRKTTDADKIAAYGALALMTGDFFAKMRNDSEYQAIVNGEWKFISRQPKDGCTSIFFRKGVLVSIAATGGKKDPAMFTFIAPGIPQPEKPINNRATLSQTSAKPATVNVINAAYTFTSSGGKSQKLGAIFFTVPTMEAALGGMEETQHFEVAIDGKTVAAIEWDGGLNARDELKQCLEDRSDKYVAKTQPPPKSSESTPQNSGKNDLVAEKSVNLGVQAMKIGDYDLAMENFANALKADPDYAPAYFYSAYILADVGKYDLAITGYSRVIELNPNEINAYYNRGLIYFEQKARFELAEADFSKMIQLDAQDARAYFVRGNLYESWGKDNLAAADRKKWKSLGGEALPEFEGQRKTLYPQAEFDSKSAAEALEPGNSTLIGSACAIYDNRRFDASYVIVKLYPVTPYFEKWYRLREKKEDKTTTVFINREAARFALATQTNGDGKFVFSRLKPGRYFVQMLFNFQQIKTERVYEGSDYDTDYYSLRDYNQPRENRMEKFIEIKKDGDTEKVTLKNKFSILGCK